MAELAQTNHADRRLPPTAMLIINADDFGRSREETDVAIQCYRRRRITSATAMVFMEDSVRAAEVGRGIGLDLGLHLNLIQPFTGLVGRALLQQHHGRVVRFLASSKYSFLVYNPALRQSFEYVYRAQVDEFVRLYGRSPSHIDGHQHKHLSTNMLLSRLMPERERVRRNFSFWPGEKDVVNRSYRRVADWWLARRYTLTDFFFSLQQCLLTNRLNRVFDLSLSASVELMTHPIDASEYAYLMSDEYVTSLSQLEAGTYASL